MAQATLVSTTGKESRSTCFSDSIAFPEMVPIRPGAYWMGATEGDDKFASVVEKPRHYVEIGYNFAVGRYPITFEQWDAYSRANPSAQRADDAGWGRGKVPAINVSWEDAVGYTRWLSLGTGRPYRLLSEAEWEYCCRAGAGTVFAGGTEISVGDANFLYLDFGDRPGVGRPVAVGAYPANAFGLYDMQGNVCELVADVFHDHYANAPGDGSAWEKGNGRYRVVRGGGWDGMPRILRAAFRDWVPADQRMDNMGFRVACTL
jgi:formylglycine-generating enzyme required for sulfatase activity